MDKISFPCLTGDNYCTWKLQMKMLLLKDGLFNIVQGTEPVPAASEVSATRTYNTSRDKALAHIVLAIDPKLLYIIGNPDNPSEVWNKLENVFQQKSFANKLRLKRKLYNLKLSSGDSLQNHLKSCSELFDALAVIDDAIAEEDKVIILLSSLPDNYSTFVTAIEALDTVPSWQTVTQRLLHEEEKILGKMNIDKVALRASEKSVISKRKCYECGKTGHIRKNCYTYLRKIKSQSSNINNANITINDNDDNVTVFASALTSFDNCNNSWIIDSGASQHMCNDKNSFSKLTKLSQPIQIVIGDGKKLVADSIGNVVIQIISPEGKTINCTITDVLFVTDLAYNPCRRCQEMIRE